MFRIYLAMLLAFASLPILARPQYQPEALQTILERVVEAKYTPVVLFDIDDTLTDTRYRTLAILREFLSEPSTIDNFKAESILLRNLSLKNVFFEIDDTFDLFGIENADFRNAAKQFWSYRFFSSEYVKIDREVFGAKKYLDQLHDKGAYIVYLTGRDEPGMKAGSLEGLKRNGFPVGTNTKLLMKPDKKIPDLEFKKQAFESVAKLGEVVGVFENEPANINAMHAFFEEATAVFVDTQHSNKPDVPEKEIFWVKNFK